MRLGPELQDVLQQLSKVLKGDSRDDVVTGKVFVETGMFVAGANYVWDDQRGEERRSKYGSYKGPERRQPRNGTLAGFFIVMKADPELVLVDSINEKEIRELALTIELYR
jgi:hypothetical protein